MSLWSSSLLRVTRLIGSAVLQSLCQLDEAELNGKGLGLDLDPNLTSGQELWVMTDRTRTCEIKWLK